MTTSAALDERVAQLKREGVDPVERAALTAPARKDVLLARADAFAAMTAGKGRPSTYGHGSRERLLKETGQKK